MKMPIRFIWAASLTILLPFCGCGDGKSETGSADASNSSSYTAFNPKVANDAKFVIGVNLDKDQLFRVVDAYVGLLAEISSLKPDKDQAAEIEEVKKKVAAYRNDVFADFDPKARAFVEKSGLRDAEARWAVVSMPAIEISDGVPRLEGLSVAVGGKVDLKKLISAIQEEPEAGASFEELALEGETAWRFVPKDDKDATEMKKLHVDPHVTALDGNLVLVAMSRDALARQIRLYRKGDGNGDGLGGFLAAEGELIRFRLSGIGDLVRKNTVPGDLKMVKMIIPNGEELLYGLGDLTTDTKVLPSGMLSDTLRLTTASEKDADQLRTLAKTGLMGIQAQIANVPNIPADMKKMAEDVKIGGSNGQVEIHSGSFGVGGVMAGALFPAISSAMLSANASVLALNGRKLYVGMMQANVERMSAGVGSVWPRTKATAGADKKDIADRASASAFEYFTALFDMEHYGTSEWDPCVDGDLLSSLGKKAVVGKTINASGLDWCIAANVTDKMPDDAIVLVSANFNPALLLRKWDGQADGKKMLPIGPRSGAARSMLGDKAIVIVRKGGAAETIKKKFLTYDVLYKKQAFDITNMDPPLMYLTPTGVAEPVGQE